MIWRFGRLSGVALFVIFAMAGGCAVSPVLSQKDSNTQIVAERDLLVEAAHEVETAPWPKPETVSLVARVTGAADEDRVTRSDAIESYIGGLQPAGRRFERLASDARINLGAADRLSRIALNAVFSARVTMNDVATVENAIQALRENRKIYTGAAEELEKLGEPVDPAEVDAIRTAYSDAIRNLGEAADALAERIEQDRTETIAARRERSGG